MPKIEININGEKLKFYNSFSFSDQIDSISASISFTSFVDFEAFDYSPVRVYRDDVLIFTGEIISKDVPGDIPKKPYIYKACSTTHILNECTLPTTAYPLQYENITLKDITGYICSFFDVTVVFDVSSSTEALKKYQLPGLKLAENAASILNELVTAQGLILTHDAYGRLIITKNIKQSLISLPRYISSGKSFDLAKFYHDYIALGQAPINEDSDIEAVASFSNIDERRVTTRVLDSGGVAAVEKKAIGMRADSYKNIRHNLVFHNFFCNIGDYIKINDVNYVVNSLNYNNNAGGETSSISLINNEVYNR